MPHRPLPAFIALALFCQTFAGCAPLLKSMDAVVSTDAAASSSEAANAEAAVDPAMDAFLDIAADGATTTLVLDRGGPVEVTLLNSYAAASGRRCKRYQLAEADNVRHVACVAGAEWVAIRPIIADSID
jgi:hypothetical protein